MNKDYVFYRSRITEKDFFEKIEESFEKIYDFSLNGKRYKFYYQESFGFLGITKSMNELRVKTITLKEKDYCLEKKVDEMLGTFGKRHNQSSNLENGEKLKIFIKNHHQKF